MTARERLHQLVEELPELDAERALHALQRWRDDPVALALETAPYDDEPGRPEEQAAVEQARDEVRRGEVREAGEVWGER